jgi:tRNA1(Val) A37 N6-methylase TrmN6
LQRFSLTQQAHSWLQNYLRNGDIVIDATAGNGFDTLFLAQHIGSEGLVYSFDIQKEALNNTQQRLIDAGLINRIQLIHANHANLNQYISANHYQKIRAMMFNLGYLPKGNKQIITLTNSTITALNHSLEWLAHKSYLTLIAYPAHENGNLETEAVLNWCQSLPISQFNWQMIENPFASISSPKLIMVEKY